MKGASVAAVAAAFVGRAAARPGQIHDLFQRDEVAICTPECTTIYETIYGEPTLYFPPAPAPTPVEPVEPVPTPDEHNCPTPGVYTFPPSTITVTNTKTVCPHATVTPKQPCATFPPGTYTAPLVVTTVTVDNVVVTCPYTSVGVPAATPAPAAPKPEAPQQDAPKPEAPKPEAPKPVTPKPETPSTGKPNLPGNTGEQWAMTYTPYSSDVSGKCKTASEVEADVASIKAAGFKSLRIYSTDCNTLETVGPAARKHGLKLIIGVFIKEDGCTYETKTVKDQVDAIAAWAQWDMVELFVIGNECVLTKKCTPGALKTLIDITKSKCSSYTGPYTTAETVNIWQEPEFANLLCPIIDVVGGQIHPYFNPNTKAADAGTFTQGQLELLDGICPGKTALNLECGWPKSGVCNGVACPGEAEQAEAIASIIRTVGSKTTFFSNTDDNWKNPGECGCERSWGCGQLFSSGNFYSMSAKKA